MVDIFGKEPKYEEQIFFEDLFKDYRKNDETANVHKRDLMVVMYGTIGVVVFVWSLLTFKNVILAILAAVSLPVIIGFFIRLKVYDRAQNMRIIETVITPNDDRYVLVHELIHTPIRIPLSEEEEKELREKVEQAPPGTHVDYSMLLRKIVGDEYIQKVIALETQDRKKIPNRKKRWQFWKR